MNPTAIIVCLCQNPQMLALLCLRAPGIRVLAHHFDIVHPRRDGFHVDAAICEWQVRATSQKLDRFLY